MNTLDHLSTCLRLFSRRKEPAGDEAELRRLHVETCGYYSRRRTPTATARQLRADNDVKPYTRHDKLSSSVGRAALTEHSHSVCRRKSVLCKQLLVTMFVASTYAIGHNKTCVLRALQLQLRVKPSLLFIYICLDNGFSCNSWAQFFN